MEDQITEVPTDLLYDVVIGFRVLAEAQSLAAQAAAFESLANDISNLASYHPADLLNLA